MSHGLIAGICFSQEFLWGYVSMSNRVVVVSNYLKLGKECLRINNRQPSNALSTNSSVVFLLRCLEDVLPEVLREREQISISTAVLENLPDRVQQEIRLGVWLAEC